MVVPQQAARLVAQGHHQQVVAPTVCGAAVSEVDVAGPLVDVQPVQEVERHAAGLRGHDLRHPAARRHPEQPQVRVGDVQVAGLPVELQPQRAPAHALRHHQLLLRRANHHALVLVVVGEFGPSSPAAAPLEDSSVGDAGVWPAAAAIEGETLRAGHRLRQRHHDEPRIYGLGLVRHGRR
uniref:Uncharacterized protein n=1 Tax=Arundo donax TaxID=35708 RepID=A0A0A8ZQ91_ARUDO